MDYANIFLYMRAEVTLTAVLVLIFLFDLFAPERMRRHFSAVACGLLVVQLLVNLVPHEAGVLFGGMFRYEPMHGVVKSILTIGTPLIQIQASEISVLHYDKQVKVFNEMLQIFHCSPPLFSQQIQFVKIVFVFLLPSQEQYHLNI